MARSAHLLLAVAALAGCAEVRTTFAPGAPRITLAYGGDGRGAIGPCG